MASYCEDKVAVVTGAGGTLCSEIAIDLAKKGAKVNCKVALRDTDATPRYWSMQYSTDNGANWTAIDTGTSISCSNGNTANMDIPKKNTAYPYQGTFTLPAAVSNGEILVRTIIVDKTSTANKSLSKASGTVRIPDFTIGGEKYDGPIFTLEQ